jgi:hypothetical protein
MQEGNGFQYVVARPEHADEVTGVLARSFVHEPMSAALGVTEDEMARFVRCFVPECVRNGLSVVAIPDGEPDTIAGVFINRDFKGDLPAGIPDDFPSFAPTFEALMTVDAAYEARRPGLRPGQAVDLWMVGVEPGGRFAGRGLAHGLFRASVDLARRAGFERCVVECTGAYSQRAALGVGFEPVARVAYRDYRHQGRAVFASIPAPHVELMLLERVFQVSPAPTAPGGR